MFRLYGKQIERSTVESCYMKFDGITWYVQKMMNEIFSMTSKGEMVSVDAEIVALQGILDSMDYVYSEMLFRLPEKQKELLLAINAATEACNITSSEFIHTYRLHSASSVQSASRILLEKDFVTCEQGVYRLYDRFLSLWLKRRF